MNLLVNLHVFSLLLLAEVSLPHPTSLKVTLDSTVALDCLQGVSKPYIEKTHTWSILQTQGRLLLPQKSRVLSLHVVNKEQKGLYECITEGERDGGLFKWRRVFEVLVEENENVEETEIVDLETGQDTILQCVPFALGYGLSVVWQRDVQGKMVKLSQGQHQVRDDITNVHWLSSTKSAGNGFNIELRDVTVEDSGLYYCTWNANGQERERTVELRVRVPPLPRCFGFETLETCAIGSSRSGRGILAESLSGFSMELYSLLRKSEPSKNMLFSPISIAGVLTHLLLGARGTTQESLEKALHLPPSFNCLHKEVRSMREDLKDSIEIANQMYYRPDLELHQEFVNQSVEFYGALPEKLTNSSEVNIERINGWVAEKTNQQIKEMVKSIPDETQLILLNAVYFNGKWKVMFTGHHQEAPFIMSSGEMVNVPVLYSPKYRLAISYISVLEAQVAVFPLSGQTRLFVLLPESISSNDLHKTESRMTENNMKELLKKMDQVTPQLTEVTLPKIKLDISTDVLDLLERLGLNDLFNNPNLCGLSSADMEPPLSLTDAQHRSFLSLTETGVEAGGATSLSFSRSFHSFSALRPFVLMLWSDQANIPLFMGRVMKP